MFALLSLVAIYSIFPFVPGVYTLAQSGQPQCLSQFGWMTNSLGQSPCDVANFAASACAGSDSLPTLSSLSQSQTYPGPTAEAASDCTCSSVTYSLLSACAACQGGSIGLWSNYTSNCSADDISDEQYPEDIPAGTAFPAWAYAAVPSGTDRWDEDNAQVLAGEGLPESTAGSAPTSTASTSDATSSPSPKKPTSTKATSIKPTSASTLTPKPSSSAAAAAKAKNTKVAAAVGGSVGGLTLVSLAMVLYKYCTRRKSEDSGDNVQPQNDGNGSVANYDGSQGGSGSPYDEKYSGSPLTPSSGNPLVPLDNIYDPFKAPAGSGNPQDASQDDDPPSSPNQYFKAAVHFGHGHGRRAMTEINLPFNAI